eukprot:GDKI01047464.1.p2 GENE.GDKI01047464.1~~GDKI01047464.1.p2  ORF type:complete len:108 (+),score=8.68 GDKI01047464.1:70-393(+)
MTSSKRGTKSARLITKGAHVKNFNCSKQMRKANRAKLLENMTRQQSTDVCVLPVWVGVVLSGSPIELGGSVAPTKAVHEEGVSLVVVVDGHTVLVGGLRLGLVSWCV